MAKKLSAVLIGCGGMSGAWLSVAAALPDLEIAGLVDIDASRAEKRRDEFHLKRAQTGSDLKTMLRLTKPDVVFDCTVPAAHKEVTLTALRHGCHVLGEKPMAESLADARRMIAAADRANRLYAVIQNRRYLPEVRRFRSLLASRALGTVGTLHADFQLGVHFGGFRDVMPHVLLIDMAIHTFDQARFMTGWEPVAVHCHEWNPPGSWYARDASAIALFEMSNGAVFSYRGSWCAEGLNTPWESEWRANGSRGSATWNGALFRAEVVAKSGGFHSEVREFSIPPAPPLPHRGQAGNIRDFLRGVRTGKPPMTVCTDNIRSLAMVLGAVESAETGRTVRIRV